MKLTKTQLREIIREEIQNLNEGLLDIIPYFKKKKEAAERELKNRRSAAYNHVKSLYEDTISELQDPKYDADRDERIKQCNRLVWVTVTGGDYKNQKINWSELKQMDSIDWNDLNEFGMMREIELAFIQILKIKSNKN